jgi:hypothetical protein
LRDDQIVNISFLFVSGLLSVLSQKEPTGATNTQFPQFFFQRYLHFGYKISFAYCVISLIDICSDASRAPIDLFGYLCCRRQQQ